MSDELQPTEATQEDYNRPPWVIIPARWRDGRDDGGVWIIDDDYTHVAHLTGIQHLETADRIIDCVEFCEGFTYQELEAMGNLKALVEKLGGAS